MPRPRRRVLRGLKRKQARLQQRRRGVHAPRLEAGMVRPQCVEVVVARVARELYREPLEDGDRRNARKMRARRGAELEQRDGAIPERVKDRERVEG